MAVREKPRRHKKEEHANSTNKGPAKIFKPENIFVDGFKVQIHCATVRGWETEALARRLKPMGSSICRSNVSSGVGEFTHTAQHSNGWPPFKIKVCFNEQVCTTCDLTTSVSGVITADLNIHTEKSVVTERGLNLVKCGDTGTV